VIFPGAGGAVRAEDDGAEEMVGERKSATEGGGGSRYSCVEARMMLRS